MSENDNLQEVGRPSLALGLTEGIRALVELGTYLPYRWLTKKNEGYGDGHPVLILPGFCLLYTSPSPRDRTRSRMPSSA